MASVVLAMPVLVNRTTRRLHPIPLDDYRSAVQASLYGPSRPAQGVATPEASRSLHRVLTADGTAGPRAVRAREDQFWQAVLRRNGVLLSSGDKTWFVLAERDAGQRVFLIGDPAHRGFERLPAHRLASWAEAEDIQVYTALLSAPAPRFGARPPARLIPVDSAELAGSLAAVALATAQGRSPVRYDVADPIVLRRPRRPEPHGVTGLPRHAPVNRVPVELYASTTVNREAIGAGLPVAGAYLVAHSSPRAAARAGGEQPARVVRIYTESGGAIGLDGIAPAQRPPAFRDAAPGTFVIPTESEWSDRSSITAVYETAAGELGEAYWLDDVARIALLARPTVAGRRRAPSVEGFTPPRRLVQTSDPALSTDSEVATHGPQPASAADVAETQRLVTAFSARQLAIRQSYERLRPPQSTSGADPLLAHSWYEYTRGVDAVNKLLAGASAAPTTVYLTGLRTALQAAQDLEDVLAARMRERGAFVPAPVGPPTARLEQRG